MLACRRAGEANAMVSQNQNRTFSCVALQDIHKGEEVGTHAQSSLPNSAWLSAMQ